MRIGFIQNWKMTRCRGNYTTAGTSLNSSASDGNWYLDTTSDSYRPYCPHFSGGGLAGAWKPAGNGYNDLIIGDTPSNAVPTFSNKSSTVAGGVDLVDSCDIDIDFELAVVAAPCETVSSANSQHTRRASASWSFVGDGTFAAPYPPTWSSVAGTGVFAPTGWTPVIDGSMPAKTSGKLANELLFEETFN
jgi:hypothetical protein